MLEPAENVGVPFDGYQCFDNRYPRDAILSIALELNQEERESLVEAI